MAVLKGEQLRHAQPGRRCRHRRVLRSSAGYGRLRIAVEAPDGRLYVLTDANPGRILLVQPVI